MVTRKQCTKVLLERNVVSKILEAPQGDSDERGGRQKLPEQRCGKLTRIRGSRPRGDFSDCVVELDPTTADSRTESTDRAVVGVICDWNASKRKSYSP